MAKYLKLPVVIEATKFSVGEIHSDVNFGHPDPSHFLAGKHWVGTLEGPYEAADGDYIITGIKGEKYPCKPDIFEATYEAV